MFGMKWYQRNCKVKEKPSISEYRPTLIADIIVHVHVSFAR